MNKQFSFIFIFVGIFLSHCSFQLENPEEEISSILHKKEPVTFKSITGHWHADSVLYKQKGIKEKMPQIKLEIISDSTFRVVSSDSVFFPSFMRGNLIVEGNTMEFKQDTSDINRIFISHTTYLGRFLVLEDTNLSAVLYFEKQKPTPDSTLMPIISGFLWELQEYKPKSGPIIILPQDNEFLYLDTKSDTLTLIQNIQGILKENDYVYEFSNDTLLIDQSRAGKLKLEMINSGSIRLWINTINNLMLPEGVKSSSVNYLIYQKVNKKNPNFINLNTLPGYWRTDSLNRTEMEYTNYQNYNDFSIGELRNINSISNTQRFPQLSAWSLTAGLFELTVDGATSEFKYSFQDDTLLTFTGLNMTIYLTKTDSAAIQNDPLLRFPYGTFLKLEINGDTTLFNFNPQYRQVDGIDQIILSDSGNQRIGFSAIPGKKILKTSNSNDTLEFTMGLIWIDSELYYTEYDNSGSRTVIVESMVDPKISFVTGNVVQGTLVNSSLDTIPISGHFQYKRKTGTFDQNFWDNIP